MLIKKFIAASAISLAATAAHAADYEGCYMISLFAQATVAERDAGRSEIDAASAIARDKYMDPITKRMLLVIVRYVYRTPDLKPQQFGDYVFKLCLQNGGVNS